MPPFPGEERILTVFADIHYYFTAPTPRPLHHRFDKGSYFYIYHNATRRTSRLEIANNPGTPEQDAFNGYLDRVQLRWAYKFPTLLTLVVDPVEPSAGGQSPPARDANEWRLASADPRDEGRYMYRLHTMDIYFWTQEDAMLVLDMTKRILSSKQRDYTEQIPSATPHAESMSPVVQQLENVAISDPAYHNGQTRNSQNQPSQATTSAPPAAAVTKPNNAPSPAQSPPSSKAEEPPQNYTPLAYNPAAPPAPEPISHREKTPPPPDAGEGTGLTAAALADHHAVASAPYQTHAGIPGPPPPQASTPWGQPPSAAQSQYSLPGQSQALQHNPSVSSTPSQHSTATPAFSPPPTGAASQIYGVPSAPGMQSPGTELYSSMYGQPHAPLQHLQPQYADYLASRPQPPPGGYSQYSYDTGHQVMAGGSQYDVHQQLYRPTEAEANSHIKPSSGGQKPGKLEERAEKYEKKVNSFLKKLEKRL